MPLPVPTRKTASEFKPLQGSEHSARCMRPWESRTTPWKISP